MTGNVDAAVRIQSSAIFDGTLHFCTFPTGETKEGWGYEWIHAFLDEHLDGSTPQTESFYNFLKGHLEEGDEAFATVCPDGDIRDIQVRRNRETACFPNTFLLFES